MSIIVQKYGGTSIGTIEKILSVADKIILEKENGNKTVMEVMSYKPDIGLKDDVFTIDFLVKK